MPKVSKKKTGANLAKQISKLLVLRHGQKRVMVTRHKSYKVMLDSACKHFPTIPRDAMTFQTNQLDICEGHHVDITSEIWDEVVDLLTSVEVTRAEIPLPIPGVISLPGNQSAVSAPQLEDSGSNTFSEDDKVKVLLFMVTSGKTLFVSIRFTTRVQKLVEYVALKLGHCSTDYRAIFAGSRMDHNRSIGSYGVNKGDIIYIQTEQLGGKPVIYLYSPSDVDVSVKLSLSPEWSFSAIYPVVTPKQDNAQHIEWNVRTHQDGNLTEKNSGLDVSYLFWEAKTNSDAFPRSPASEPQSVDVFSPTSSTLGDMDSIVISVDKVTVYLDESLKVLGLHTEARTSFITISPQPDVVTRVFMLFRGICKEHLVDWSNAQMQAEKDVAWWADVVGVDLARASDMALFRVLEWGGMEVRI
ncbi:hypothetical protein BDR05DRAFT_971431 [Suillus weaverae]|nr:hypothetical protein BDR05DRAFT_971431 [Suillus weaverae]